LIRKIS